MLCEQARQLFDAYLDDEISPALKSEMGAHLLECSSCRQSIALMEVTGHILTCDSDEEQLDDEFTNRLLACLGKPSAGPFSRFRKMIYVGGPLAAAAVVAFAFMGVFDRGDSRVMGEKATVADSPIVVVAPHDNPTSEPVAGSTVEDPLERWLREGQETAASEPGAVEQEPPIIGLTLLQLLDYLDEAVEEGRDSKLLPAAEPVPAATFSSDDEVEDL